MVRCAGRRALWQASQGTVSTITLIIKTQNKHNVLSLTKSRIKSPHRGASAASKIIRLLRSTEVKSKGSNQKNHWFETKFIVEIRVHQITFK